MRCPYCGGLNADRADFCVHCGRDLKARQNQPGSRQPPSQNPYQPPVKPVGADLSRPQPKPGPVQHTDATSHRGAPVATHAPPAPEPPAPFPPRTMEQLWALEAGALAYSVADTALVVNRKKVVSILYPQCAAWQQVATLLKAYKEQQEDKFATTIIQGYHQQQPNSYTFTNGQITVDRGVLLGSQKINRYQIETDNGFEASSVRIVLSEPA